MAGKDGEGPRARSKACRQLGIDSQTHPPTSGDEFQSSQQSGEGEGGQHEKERFLHNSAFLPCGTLRMELTAFHGNLGATVSMRPQNSLNNNLLLRC